MKLEQWFVGAGLMALLAVVAATRKNTRKTTDWHGQSVDEAVITNRYPYH